MWCLCICQQPDNSDLFKGHGPASLVGVCELSYSGEGGEGLSKWVMKPRSGGFKSVRRP